MYIQYSFAYLYLQDNSEKPGRSPSGNVDYCRMLSLRVRRRVGPVVALVISESRRAFNNHNLRKATSVATPATGIYYKLSLIHYGQETLNFENVEPVKRPWLLCPYSRKGVITT